MSGELLALLYDWHNRHRLSRQAADVPFYRDLLPSGRVWVLGAGTGRLAVPLARSGRQVVAVDRDVARLDRIPDTPGLSRWHGDIAHLPEAADAAAVAPYSTLQLVSTHDLADCLLGASRVLGPDGALWCDLSDSFQAREGHARRRVIVAECPELGGPVAEDQETVVHADRIELRAWWSLRRQPLAHTVEHWHFHPTPTIVAAATSVGLRLLEELRGYGAPETLHRRILVFGRAGRRA